ncbi:hypothetical protein PIB30_085151, partial [Stylosanthes scabra]|nr:hypothetical protein [Stylosanthes scabra]
FKTDCQELYQAIKSNSNMAEITSILQDINSLKQGVQELGVTWVPRQANALAHQFAIYQRVMSSNVLWNQNLPTMIENK